MTFELRKYHLIKTILASKNESIINKLELVINENAENDVKLMELSKPMRDKLDIDELMQEQNYKHPSNEELDNIIDATAIEEPIEELLKMI